MRLLAGSFTKITQPREPFIILTLQDSDLAIGIASSSPYCIGFLYIHKERFFHLRDTVKAGAAYSGRPLRHWLLPGEV